MCLDVFSYRLVFFVLFNLRECTKDQGLNGSSTLGPETSMLAYLDEAVASYGLQVNGSVMRRALKSMVNDSFRLENWGALVTDIKETITKRFVTDDDKVTPDEFYMIMVSQVFQKMLRTASSKFKPKAGMFLKIFEHNFLTF